MIINRSPYITPLNRRILFIYTAGHVPFVTETDLGWFLNHHQNMHIISTHAFHDKNHHDVVWKFHRKSIITRRMK